MNNDKLTQAIIAAGISRNIIEEGAPVSEQTLLNIVACLGMGPKQAQPAQEPVGYLVECLSEEIPSTLWKHPFGEDRDGKWRNTPLYPHPQPSAPVAQSDRIDAYARNLAMHLWNEHYMKDSPQFELCDDTLGVMTQIDNMLTGLTRKAERNVLTDEEIDRIQTDAYMKLAASGYNGGMGGLTWDRASARAVESAVRALLSTAPQVEQVEAKAVQTQDAAINDFVEGYECDTGEGIYMPTEHERFLINDAIRTFLADQDWYMTAAPASQKEGEQGNEA